MVLRVLLLLFPPGSIVQQDMVKSSAAGCPDHVSTAAINARREGRGGALYSIEEVLRHAF